MHVCLFVPCGHLLGKNLPLGSSLWCLIASLSLSHRYPRSGVVQTYLIVSITDLCTLTYFYTLLVAANLSLNLVQHFNFFKTSFLYYCIDPENNFSTFKDR